MRIKPGQVLQIHYGKRYPGMPYQNQNVRIKIVSTGSPLNILVKLRNKTLVVVPFGNLCERNKYK